MHYIIIQMKKKASDKSLWLFEKRYRLFKIEKYDTKYPH
jgi:hypothetical protein